MNSDAFRNLDLVGADCILAPEVTLLAAERESLLMNVLQGFVPSLSANGLSWRSQGFFTSRCSDDTLEENPHFQRIAAGLLTASMNGTTCERSEATLGLEEFVNAAVEDFQKRKRSAAERPVEKRPKTSSDQ
jgi:hypothetical protein